MRREGLLEEVAGLAGRMGATASQAVGYRQLLAVVRGEITEKEGFRQVERATLDLVKRQRTFFRRDPRIRWLPWSQDPTSGWPWRGMRYRGCPHEFLEDGRAGERLRGRSRILFLFHYRDRGALRQAKGGGSRRGIGGFRRPGPGGHVVFQCGWVRGRDVRKRASMRSQAGSGPGHDRPSGVPGRHSRGSQESQGLGRRR